MYSIKELEKLSGIKAHTLRMWERRYNILEPHRTDTNIRYYDETQLVRLLNVKTLISNNWKISKIGKLSDQELKNEVEKASSAYDHHQYESQINGLLQFTLNYNEKEFSRLLDQSVKELGLAKTVVNIIYPYLYKIGVMWRVDNVMPVQEHFASNLIRQKLLAAIDQLGTDFKKEEKFMLFLPEYEYHEISLLLCNYVLRDRGFQTFYFGSNVPFDNVIYGQKTIKPDYLFLFMVTPREKERAIEYLNKLSREFKGKRIFIAGKYVESLKQGLPSNITFLSSVDDLEAQL